MVLNVEKISLSYLCHIYFTSMTSACTVMVLTPSYIGTSCSEVKQLSAGISHQPQNKLLTVQKTCLVLLLCLQIASTTESCCGFILQLAMERGWLSWDPQQGHMCKYSSLPDSSSCLWSWVAVVQEPLSPTLSASVSAILEEGMHLGKALSWTLHSPHSGFKSRVSVWQLFIDSSLHPLLPMAGKLKLCACPQGMLGNRSQ